jgi:hypothetical protein
VSDWALIFPSPILSQLQGWRWCQKIRKNVLQINLLSFCATIELKLSKLQKIIKIEEKVIKNLFSLDILDSMQFDLNLRAKNHQMLIPQYFPVLLPPRPPLKL